MKWLLFKQHVKLKPDQVKPKEDQHSKLKDEQGCTKRRSK